MFRFLFLALLMVPHILRAAEPLKPVEPPELVADRAEFLRAMQRASVQPLSNYLRLLQSRQQFFAREGKAEAAAAVAAEVATIKEQLTAAQAASDLTTAAPTQLQIDKAEFGDFQRNRVLDVTKYVQNAFTAGKATVSLRGTDMVGASDPSPGVHKSIRIVYTINGKRKERLFKDGPDALLDFKKDLK
jgi:hypothetical protein